ncbi:hypothetical protein Barb7_00175 [Bacteroidales bacterium Barb7]|nr:hypothetical protein Barb7_00175 [Bacteroidales bacterium Barb7]
MKSIAENIKSRTEIKLDRFLDAMIVVLKHSQRFITDNILEDLATGLAYLKDEIVIQRDDDNEIAIKKLLLNRSASRLLVLLKKYHLEKNENVPQYITDWENMCMDVNEFSVIRNIWINADVLTD